MDSSNPPDETPPVEGATSEAPAPSVPPTGDVAPEPAPAPETPPTEAPVPEPAGDANTEPDPDGSMPPGSAPVPAPADGQAPADKPKTPLDASLLTNPAKLGEVKKPRNGVALTIAGTVVLMLALAGLAVYAYLKSR